MKNLELIAKELCDNWDDCHTSYVGNEVLQLLEIKIVDALKARDAEWIEVLKEFGEKVTKSNRSDR